jgi:uncharacterized protein YigE (DUF2233 family)
MKFRYFTVTFCVFILWGSATVLFAHWKIAFSSPPVPLLAGAYFQEGEVVGSEGTKVRLYAVLFHEAKCRLRVLDNPPSRATSLESLLLREKGYFAGVNGGYFHTDGAPLGLVVSEKQVLNRMQKARLLSGVLEVQENSIRLLRPEEYRFSQRVMNALQAGPFLIEHGRIIRGLNTLRVARRTVVASNGAGLWALISMGPLTLAQAAEVLAIRNIFPGWYAWNALNLDGGSSTAFWAATKPQPVSIHEFGTVRNFLCLTPRSSH